MLSRKEFGTMRIPVASARPATVKSACAGRRSMLRTAMRNVCDNQLPDAGPLDKGGTIFRRWLGAHGLGWRQFCRGVRRP